MGPAPTARILEKIAAALAGQEKRRADHRKTLPAKPLRQGLLQWVKKSACECAAEGAGTGGGGGGRQRVPGPGGSPPRAPPQPLIPCRPATILSLTAGEKD